MAQALSGRRNVCEKAATSSSRSSLPQNALENATNHEHDERLHEEFRRRVKTQGSLPNEDAALVLLFSLVASGQIKLRKIDGWQKIGAVLNEQTAVAA